MSDPCQRCGDPDEDHAGMERGTAVERNCALYRIGTQLEHVNRTLIQVNDLLWHWQREILQIRRERAAQTGAGHSMVEGRPPGS